VPSLKVRFWDPGHWRFRAEETRTVADQMTHEDARTILRRIANDYDRLAKLADEQLAAQEKQKRLNEPNRRAPGSGLDVPPSGEPDWTSRSRT
jgi:hypothetical protein